MKAQKVWQITRSVAWGLAFGGAIMRIVLIATGHPMDKTNQFIWVPLTLGWIAIGFVNSATIAKQRKTIDLLTGRQQQRDRAWLS